MGDLPADVQVKLLRVLQEREFERVGGTETLRCDVRVISATNRDLEGMVSKSQFREDLYYRLNVFPIDLPPLRGRPSDIPLLAEHFALKFARRAGRPVIQLDPSAIERLKEYAWPGNVRELENVMERAIIVMRGNTLSAADLDFGRRSAAMPAPSEGPRPSDPPPVGGAGVPLQKRLHEQERAEIIAAIERSSGNIAMAARALGINRSTLYYRLRKHDLEHLLPSADEPK